MLNKVLILALTLSALQSKAWIIQSGETKLWLEQQQPKASVYTEMNKYFQKDDTEVAHDYVANFIDFMHNYTINEAEASITQKLSQPYCKSTTTVSYPTTLTNTYNFKSKKSFEQEVFKIQSYECLGKLDIHKVFKTLLSDEFQIKSINGLKVSRSDQSTNKVCQQVVMFPFGEAKYCFTQNILFNGNQYVIQSYNEQNIDNASTLAYYRNAITVISQLANGEVSIYNLVYARGPKLPFHAIVESVIKSQQKSVLRNLIQDSK